LEKLLDVTHNAGGKAGLLMDSRKRYGSIERELRPVIKDLYLAPEARVILVGFFQPCGNVTVKSTVCIRL